MSKIEKEIKILDIEIEQLKRKLDILGANLKNDGIQKIYVYDLPSIYARFYDCMMQLDKCSKPYDIEICKNKLKTLFLEIDNLLTKKQQENLFTAIGYKHLKDILSISDINRFKNVLSTSEVIKIIKQFSINPNKWIRLRETNGKTTITIKHILNEELQAEYGTKMQPVLETEMEVPSIESGNAILEQLGFSFRNYQEKKRTTYVLDNTEIDIDSWPLIPPYLEIEGESDEQINKIVQKLELSYKEMVSCNTAEVYKKYGIDIYQFRELRFEEKNKGLEL
ncbi:MAG: CYTH domain-containing protein [Clostridiales bacterium]|nr:CYTH domain-containing protein [Clostridiales bacterium]